MSIINANANSYPSNDNSDFEVFCIKINFWHDPKKIWVISQNNTQIFRFYVKLTLFAILGMGFGCILKPIPKTQTKIF